MASMKTKDATISGIIANFRIHGQVSRQIGPPLSAQNSATSCLQTYFYDPEDQIKRRPEMLSPQPNQHDKDKAVFQILQITLHQVNCYLDSFQNIQQIVQSGHIQRTSS